VTAAMRDTVSADLRTTLRALKLGQMLATLPDRLTLARQQKMTHADFLELVLADEHARREAKSAGLRARAAGLDAGMRLDTWDETAAVRFGQLLLDLNAGGQTLVLVTHSPDLAARYAKRTVRLVDGEVASDSAASDVTAGARP
jgi:ABC-type thiamine transport system ATPase subunit